jgi:hypothetical protein
MERIDRVRVMQAYGKLTPLCDHPAANLTDFCALGYSPTRPKYWKLKPVEAHFVPLGPRCRFAAKSRCRNSGEVKHQCIKLKTA